MKVIYLQAHGDLVEKSQKTLGFVNNCSEMLFGNVSLKLTEALFGVGAEVGNVVFVVFQPRALLHSKGLARLALKI